MASEAGCLHEALDPAHVVWVLIQVILAGRGQLCDNSGAPSSGAQSVLPALGRWPGTQMYQVPSVLALRRNQRRRPAEYGVALSYSEQHLEF